MFEPSSTLAVFRNPAFRNLWFATLASNFGGIVQAVGAAWLMTSLTTSEGMVALVQSSVTLPIMIFSLTAGVFADNFDRRKIMLWAQAFMCLASVGLAFLAFEGMLTPWLLLAFTFLIGCGTALHNPSWQATMGDIVPRDDLPTAVALNSMGFNMMRSIGPADRPITRSTSVMRLAALSVSPAKRGLEEAHSLVPRSTRLGSTPSFSNASEFGFLPCS